MANLNKVQIIGRLGGDPETRSTNSGASVTVMNVATNEYWTDKQGQKQERTEWHRIVVWGKLAEICAKHLAKGRRVFVEGRLQTRKWEDKQGQKRYTTEIVAYTVQFLDSTASQGEQQSSGEESFDTEPAFDSSEDLPF